MSQKTVSELIKLYDENKSTHDLPIPLPLPPKPIIALPPLPAIQKDTRHRRNMIDRSSMLQKVRQNVIASTPREHETQILQVKEPKQTHTRNMNYKVVKTKKTKQRPKFQEIFSPLERAFITPPSSQRTSISSNSDTNTSEDDDVPQSLDKRTLKKLQTKSPKRFVKQIKRIQKDTLVPLFIHDNSSWMQINTKNYNTIMKNDELIILLFDPLTQKQIFTGMGRIIKKANKNIKISVTPLLGEQNTKRSFKYIHDYKPCLKKCVLNLVIEEVLNKTPSTHPIKKTAKEQELEQLILQNNNNDKIIELRNKLREEQKIRRNNQEAVDQKETNFFPIRFSTGQLYAQLFKLSF